MANLTKTIAVLFQGEDAISPTMTSITRGIDQFSSKVEAIADPFSKVTDGVVALDTALITLAAAGLSLAFNASKNFETASVSLAKNLGGEADQIKQAEIAVLGLSNKYGEAAVGVLNSTTDFKKAGYSIQESLALVETGIGLVIGASEAELDIAKSTEVIISTLKGFNAPASEAGRLTDILNKVSNEYATSVNELAIGMAGLSPIAKLAGLSMEETAGVLTPVIEVFRSGDEAATALKTGLLKLIDDSKPVQDALKSIGVAQRDSNGDLRSGKDILFDVAKAFETTDEKSKLYVASQLVGIHQAGRMVTVFDSLAKTTEITGVAMKSAGSIQEEVNLVMKTSEVSVNRVLTSFTNLGIKIGNEFRQAGKGVFDGATDIEIALQEVVGDKTFAPVFAAINGFSTDMGEALKTIARNIPEAFKHVDFTKLVGEISGVAGEFEGLFSDLDLSTPEGLASAIQTVIDTLTSLATVTQGIVQSFGPVFETITGLISSFNQMDAESQKSAGNILGAAKAITELGFKTAAAIVIIGGAADKLAGPFEVAVNLISGTFNSALTIWNTAKLAVFEIIDDLLAVSNMLTLGLFSDDIEANRIALASWKKSVKTDLIDTTEKAVNDLTGLNISFDDLRKGAESSAEGIAKISDAADTATEKLYDIPDQKDVSVSVTSSDAEWTAITDEIEAIPAAKNIKITTDASKAMEELSYFDGAGKEHTILVPVESKNLETVKKEIDAIPTEKQVEIKLQGYIDKQIAQITASAEIAQSAFEWTAKIDIAEAEAAAATTKAAFDAAGESVSSLSNSTSDMFSSLVSNWDNLSKFDQNVLTREVEKQRDAQNKALDSQIKLNDAQAEYMKAKTESLANGGSEIQIDSSGLEPALEMIMWQIIEKVQIRATESSSEFLLGL